MESKAYILYLNNKILGVFDNEKLLKNFINGGIQNKFFHETNLKTQIYEMNSCYNVDINIEKNITIQNISNNTNIVNNKEKETLEKEKIIKLLEKKKIEKDIKTKESEMEKSDEFKKIMQDKIDLNSKINELKYEKKKLLEAENTYKNDIKLYELFIKEKEKNSDFNIPELFNLKFDIFTRLSNDNQLTFENFKEEYDKLKPKNDYDDVFKVNAYEESFTNNKKSDFEMNFSIEL